MVATVAWPKPGHSLVMTGVDWARFAHLAKRNHTGTRLAYDQGTLELISPSFLHDRSDRILARFVVTLTEERGHAIVEGGSMTLKRKSRKRDIEADDIFWIANAPALAGKRSINLAVDPPPDLVIEVDVIASSNCESFKTGSVTEKKRYPDPVLKDSLNRLAIYASLGMPELWRYRNGQLQFLNRDGDSYRPSSTSRSFPFVMPNDLLPFLVQAIQTGNTNQAVASLRDWIRRVPQ